MAKKKQNRRKKIEAELSDQSLFWPMAWAVILFVAAFFVLLGGFNAGGPLPKTLFHGTYWLIGWAGFFLPLALAYWGIVKLTREDKKMPMARLIGLGSSLVFIATSLFTALASRIKDGFSGGHGGQIGQLIGRGAFDILDKVPASILFIVLALLSISLGFGITPASLAKLLKLFKGSREGEESELAALKSHASERGFQLNEGVPVVHHNLKESPRHSTFKNTAQKVLPTDNREALTTRSDPAWKFPSIQLLNQQQDKADAGNISGNAEIIHDTLANFNIEVEMEGANIGPRVTQYTLKPPAGAKLNKITALSDNLALDLAAHSIRIEAPIPGKRAVGVEVPNVKPALVRISSLLQSRDWTELKGNLGFTIGKDIGGNPIVGNLDRMPHLLVAGQTGSGKSIMLNSLLISLLYRSSPSDLKLILVDPKQVELTPYNDIPHLLSPVITEPEKCISALKWAVAEMERRLKAIAEVGKRNIDEYNNLKQEAGMPYIVIVIDELADLMMMAARDVEALIVRIAQKARAVGIHLVIATQRPSVDVITGLIKANVPARIAFTTASQVDSRTIIDQIGAEKLLGQGDMLLLTADMPKPKRVQGAYIGEDEIKKVSDFLREQRPPQYDEEVVSQPVQLGKGGVVSEYGSQDADDDMWRDAVQVVVDARKASTSLLQRRLRIGYGRAARLIETMEEQGIIGASDGSRPREVLINNASDVFGGNAEPEPTEPAEPAVLGESVEE